MKISVGNSQMLRLAKPLVSALFITITIATDVLAADTFYDFSWSAAGNPSASITGAVIDVNQSGIIQSVSGGNLIWNGVSQGAITGYSSSNIAFVGTTASNNPFFTGGVLSFTTSSGTQSNYVFQWWGPGGDNNNYSLGIPSITSYTNRGVANVTQQVPEIDGATLPKALLLLGSLFLVVYSRREKIGGTAGDRSA